jgi:hypothetical protein
MTQNARPLGFPCRVNHRDRVGDKYGPGPSPLLPNSSQTFKVGSQPDPGCDRYPGDVPAEPVMTAEEWFERMRDAPPPTDDDVSILWDGTRLDSREKVMAWLAEVELARAEEQAASRTDGQD